MLAEASPSVVYVTGKPTPWMPQVMVSGVWDLEFRVERSRGLWVLGLMLRFRLLGLGIQDFGRSD